MAQAKNIDATAMLTSGIVTPSIVNQRAARRSLIAEGLHAGGEPQLRRTYGGELSKPHGGFQFSSRKIIVDRVAVKDFSKWRENLLIRSRYRNFIRPVCVSLCLFSVSAVLALGQSAASPDAVVITGRRLENYGRRSGQNRCHLAALKTGSILPVLPGAPSLQISWLEPSCSFEKPRNAIWRIGKM
jgi:hypothetical protein